MEISQSLQHLCHPSTPKDAVISKFHRSHNTTISQSICNQRSNSFQSTSTLRTIVHLLGSSATSNFLLSGGLEQGSYDRGQGQAPLDPYNQEGDPYGDRSRGYDDPYYGRRGEADRTQGPIDPYGNTYGESHGSRDGYDRTDPYRRVQSQGRGGGYGAAGDSDNYPSSYTAVPVPGYTAKQNCTGSGCCVPKCFAEKGSRVSICPRERAESKE